MNDPQYIILHCSASPDRGVKDWTGIRRYHMEDLGWRDVGYHFGVERIDSEYVIVRGRKPWSAGAHCKHNGMNAKSLGVCMVGHFDEQTVPPEQWDKTAQLCADLCEEYSIPIENIHPHNMYNPGKSCPGKMVNMDEFRAKAGLLYYGSDIEADPDDKPEKP